MSGHWDSISTATPLEDFRKMRDETEDQILNMDSRPLPEQLAVAAAACAALAEAPSPVQRPKKRSRWARRSRSSWINDATVAMIGRGWRP